MKPRNREVSIFNLSMMDVISGAMGAFLILVVLLSRHYDPDPIDTEAILEMQRELVRATGQIDEASRRIDADSRDTQSVLQALRQAKGNVDAAKTAVAGLRNDLATAAARINLLEEEAQEMQNELARREPFLFEALWECSEESDVDLYLHSNLTTEDGRPMPPFNPESDQGRFFSNTAYTDGHDVRAGTELWLYDTTTPGNEIGVYYRLAGDNRPDCSVRGYLISSSFTMIRVPPVTLNARKPWSRVGTIRIDDRSTVSFETAGSAP